jgi:hypothetical protein
LKGTLFSARGNASSMSRRQKQKLNKNKARLMNKFFLGMDLGLKKVGAGPRA